MTRDEPTRTSQRPTPTEARAGTVVDPVCGMEVALAPGALMLDHAGRSFGFCSAHCLARFRAEPARYLAGVKAGLPPGGA